MLIGFGVVLHGTSQAKTTKNLSESLEVHQSSAQSGTGQASSSAAATLGATPVTQPKTYNSQQTTPPKSVEDIIGNADIKVGN